MVDLNQNQVDALGDFVYTEGAGHFAQRTLLRVLNKRDYNAAANQLPRWDMYKGKHNDNLKKRRAEEKALFLKQ